MCQHLTVARVAEALAVLWNTANGAVLTEGRRVLISDPHLLRQAAVGAVGKRHRRQGEDQIGPSLQQGVVMSGSVVPLCRRRLRC